MPQITRRLEFDAGHRILRHESKCAHLHGHRYVAEITVKSPELDDKGRVVDFGVIKELIGGWIDENWDHNILLNEQDPLVLLTKPALSISVQSEDIFGGKEPYIMANELNPTAEVMAEELLKISQGLLPAPLELRVIHVRLFETPNCWADAYPLLP